MQLPTQFLRQIPLFDKMMTQSLESFKTINLSGIWLIAAAIYIVSFIIYRLYFHPLSGIPGPRLAAITSWYETYYDLFKTPSGQYWNKLDELHKEYGPIIRINPDEIQIHDPEFYSQIYAGGATKRHRYARSVSGNGSPGSMASAVSHDLHRLRRSSLNPFFSRSAVLRLEERIQSRRCFETCRLIKIAHNDTKANSTTKQTQINLFTEALDRLPEEEIETQRLADEALVLITAGSETTSRALATIIYHVLRNPHILSNLRQELDAAIPDANMEVPYLALEALPYLSATIRESLRISALVPNRSLLTADEPLQYKQWSLKPGTAFCMNTSKYLLDASIYNNPTMFDPERWLGDTQRTQKLLHHFAPFSKGHRGCIGMK
ncbi:hypothetical protein ACSS6W_011075 [Trichoderma asperelloides]